MALAFERPLKIVLTGGPCAGKTTALEKLSSYLRERGFRVYTVPEAATLLFSNGADLSGGALEFQKAVLETQMSLEDTFERMALSTGEKSVLLCDRGTCDGKAYVSSDTWRALLESRATLTSRAPGDQQQIPEELGPAEKDAEKFGTNMVQISEAGLREGRYNAVFHLVSAADGAEPFYSLENNQTRRESAEEARERDMQTQRAWMGHPHHYVFDNRSHDGFEGKMQRVVDTMTKIVGLPLVQRYPTKFLLLDPPLNDEFSAKLQTEEISGEVTSTRKESNDALEGALTSALLCLTAASTGYGVNRGTYTDAVQVFEVEKVYIRDFGEMKKERVGRVANVANKTQLQYSFIRRRTQHVLNDGSGFSGAGISVFGYTMVSKHLSSGERTVSVTNMNRIH